jgi:hypothetical protein
LPRARAFAAIVASAARFNSESSAASAVGLNSFCGMRNAAPASERKRALAVW